MLAPDRLLPFLAAVALVELTPGPNMGYLALVASRYGRLAGLATVAGITLGLAAYLAAAIAGVSEAAARWPGAYHALRWAGVGYLLWLAFDAWRGAGAQAASIPPAAGRLFLRGLMANLLNPKAAVFYVALLPGFTDPGAGPVAGQALALGAIHLTVSLMVHLSIVHTAAGAKPALDTWTADGRGDLLQKGFAAGLVAIAAWLAWSTR